MNNQKTEDRKTENARRQHGEMKHQKAKEEFSEVMMLNIIENLDAMMAL